MTTQAPDDAAAQRDPGVDDDTTRHLSAAVHVDEDFADEVIEEFLSEKRRSVPPSPGIEPATVLGEAISARRWRVVRDSIVLGMFLVLLVLWFPVTAPWLAASTVGYLLHSWLRSRARRRGRGEVGADGWLLVALSASLAGFLVAPVATGAFLEWRSGLFDSAGSSTLGDYGYSDGYPDYEAGSTAWTAVLGTLNTLCVFGLLAVVLGDRFRVHLLLRDRFAPQNWPEAAPAVTWSPGSPPWYAHRLHLVRETSEQSNVRVHHGYDPFVGSGELVRGWSIAIQLRPREGEQQQQLLPGALYDAVREEVLAMSEPGALAPGGRLRLLQEGREAITSASELLRHRTDPFGRAVLPDPSLPPASRVDPEVVDQLQAQYPEWVRPYQYFRVESWNKDLVLSTYLHIACDDTTLYLEWNAYALNPVAPERRYDGMEMRRPGYALRRALLDWVLVPTTLVRRGRNVWRTARDAWNSGRSPADVDSYGAAACYGARCSIREMAADTGAQTYLQYVDSVRYVKLLERRSLAAVDHALAEHGLSTEEFARQATTVVNSTVVTGGDFRGVNVFGQGNATTAGSGEKAEQDSSARK